MVVSRRNPYLDGLYCESGNAFVRTASPKPYRTVSISADMQPVPHLLNRLCALFLLGSVLVGVLAPGAVAMSRSDIQEVAGQEGLSSDVQDFLNGVLEDAMLRAVMVSPASTPAQNTLRTADERPPVLVISTGVMEMRPANSLSLVDADQLAHPDRPDSNSGRQGPVSPRAP